MSAAASAADRLGKAFQKRRRLIEFIEGDYPTLVHGLHSVIPRIDEFVGKERIPYPEKW